MQLSVISKAAGGISENRRENVGIGGESGRNGGVMRRNGGRKAASK
jgi:hypothetical protein